jgi:hypothetical protein
MTEEQGGASGSPNVAGLDFVTLGALVVLASWVIFDVITDDYIVATVAAALAAAIVLLPRIDVAAVTSIAPVSAFLKLAGYTLAVVGLVELINDIESNLFDAGGATIFGAIVAYVGYVLAFVGARNQ